MEDIKIKKLLTQMVKKNASDLHLSAGRPPEIRVNGELLSMEAEPLKPQVTRELAYSLISSDQIEIFEHKKELDFSYGIEGLGRFRINFYRQRGSIGIAIRHIPYVIPTMDELGLPSTILKEFSMKSAGLFLVTGPTGCGKSTTLASMISYINQRRKSHIVSIEDPIEYLHQHNKSIVNQREVGVDTLSFGSALKHIFRQDPDIILIGELRDLETIHTALTLAETGHLVLSTLHTIDTTHAVSRIVDVFPPHHQQQIRIQLSMVLLGVLAQQLLPDKECKRRVLIYELMRATNSIQNMVRENDLPQIRSAIHTGRNMGMGTMNQCIADRLQKGIISVEEGFKHSFDQEELSLLLKRTGY